MTNLHYLNFERFNTEYFNKRKEECNLKVSEEKKER